MESWIKLLLLSVTKLCVGLIAIGGLPFLYFSYTWGKINDFCEEIDIGINIDKIKLHAKAEGFLVGGLTKRNWLLITSTAGFGRASCEIHYADGKVIKAEYVFLD